MKIYIFGAGKVGCALARALRSGGATVTLRGARRGFPKRAPKANLVILALRDGALAACASQLADGPAGALGTVVHCAGALDAEVLGSLRARECAVGQLHPLVSLAGGSGGIVAGTYAHVSGDARAVRLGRAAARLAGMRPFTVEGLNHTLYHACAALLANGGAALASAATTGFARAGCDAQQATVMLGSLLVSVGRNLQELGLPTALTGPVRRGSGSVVRAHLATLQRCAPELVDIYRALAAAQLPLARDLAEATPEDFDEIERLLSRPLVGGTGHEP